MLTKSGKFYIYEIYNNVTQRKYIGVTQDPKTRFYSHLMKLRRGTHTAENIVADFVKYGEDSFSFKIIDLATSKEEGLSLESKYIYKFKTYVPEFGYNGNDYRFYRNKCSLKISSSEITQKIKTQGYKFREIAWMLGLRYRDFVFKLNHLETFTEEEYLKLIEIISIPANIRWLRNVKNCSS